MMIDMTLQQALEDVLGKQTLRHQWQEILVDAALELFVEDVSMGPLPRSGFGSLLLMDRSSLERLRKLTERKSK